MKDAAGSVGCGMALVGLLLVLVIGSVACTTKAAGLPAQLAQIEQLRGDAANVDPVQAEDVIGQVTQWNQTIRSNQALNKTWYAGWVIPDEWDSVELLSVPGRE